jgi:hypothetical protein
MISFVFSLVFLTCAQIASLHSFRRLGATLAKIKGTPNDLIMFLGRWKSDTFMTYFMFDDDEQIAINSKLLG